ncbi:hypothetical protein IFM89_024624 [Coptis chinensis]|uniref:Pentatricopeptide repeat-containing protein n=1 Tax=Coptis chinensis TaxID=261450 RepID=A0A835I7P9_9MAGN|nr:hypothetical protein IFM89_024624 [Coptis chinensis]
MKVFPTATYTILICGLCNQGLEGEAQQIFEEMEKKKCFPTVMTFNALIRGLCKVQKLEEAKILFFKMEIGRNPSLFLRLSQGADQVLDSASLQTMVERLRESGKILKAYKLLRQLANSGVVPSLFTYNILMNGFCKSGDINSAFKLFKDLQLKGYSPDAITYGTLIDGLQRVNREEDALHVFHQMERNSVSQFGLFTIILMKCYCRKRKWILAFSLWMKYMRGLPDHNNERLKLMEKNVDLGNIEVAVRGVLEMDMKCKVVESSLYNIFLTGLCQAGMLDQALKIFNVLEECKVSVTPPSCVYLINCLCHEKKQLRNVSPSTRSGISSSSSYSCGATPTAAPGASS